MRFDFLEITIFERPQIETRKERDHYEYRHSEFELREQSLPEYARVSEVSEPHPVGDESDAHGQERQRERYDHDHKRQTSAPPPASCTHLRVYVFLFSLPFWPFSISKLCQCYILPAYPVFNKTVINKYSGSVWLPLQVRLCLTCF